jgi:hypothetical protein
VPRPCQSSSAGSQQRPGRRAAAAAAVLDAVSTAGMAWQHGDASFAETLGSVPRQIISKSKGENSLTCDPACHRSISPSKDSALATSSSKDALLLL